jgi:hypothetical protein
LRRAVPKKGTDVSLVNTLGQLRVANEAGPDPLDVAALSAIEHLRQFGITTPIDVGRVLGRAAELMILGGSRPLPRPAAKPGEGGPLSAGDCPRCGAGVLTCREDRRKPSAGGPEVHRIFLACTMPECGYVES